MAVEIGKAKVMKEKSKVRDTMFRRVNLYCFTFAFSFFLAIATATAAEVDGVAAIVGTHTILKSDVLMEMRQLNASASQFATIRDQLIDRKLILRAAADAKVTMQDWVVENRVRDIIARSFGGDRNKLMATLSQQKVSYPEWRGRIREDLIVSAMRWNVIDKYVTARPAVMRKEFEAHPYRYQLGSTVTVSVILLKPEDAAKRDEVSAALGSEDFAEVARRYSADTHAADGGVWRNIIPRDVFKPEICTEIEKMPCATISRWIELDGWSFLLRKDNETPGKPRTFEEAYDEIKAVVEEEEAKVAYQAWMARLREETYIKLY